MIIETNCVLEQIGNKKYIKMRRKKGELLNDFIARARDKYPNAQENIPEYIKLKQRERE